MSLAVAAGETSAVTRFFFVWILVAACTNATEPVVDPCALVGTMPDATCPDGCQVFTARVADTSRSCVLPESRVTACGLPDVHYSGGLALTCFEHTEQPLAFIHTSTSIRDYEDASAPDRLLLAGWEVCPDDRGLGFRLELPDCE